MTRGDDQLTQTTSGLWIPKLSMTQKNQLAQQPQQEAQEDPEPVRDWEVYWKAQGQPWRQEPEIGLERQQFLSQRLEIKPDYDQQIFPFKDIALTRADVEWLLVTHEDGREPVEWNDESQRKRKGLDLSGIDLHHINLSNLPLAEANLRSAHLEGANLIEACLSGADLTGAYLTKAYLIRANLTDADLTDADLERAQLGLAHLEGALFLRANLKVAFLTQAYLARTQFDYAHLAFADLSMTNCEQATFIGANMQNALCIGANLTGADLHKSHLEDVQLNNAFLRDVRLSDAFLAGSYLGGVVMADEMHVGPQLADVHWNDVNLAVVKWSQMNMVREEYQARQRKEDDGQVKDSFTREEEYDTAVRTYRQIVIALESQGLKEEAERFAFRAQIMQRSVLWWRLRQGGQSFWQHINNLGACLFSWLLALLSGYGYRFGRSLSWYIGILLAFAWFYVHLSQGVPPHASIPDHLSLLDAMILSISDMVGRGFFTQNIPQNDLYAGCSVLEGVIGVFMDVLLISTLTQRLFKK